jgi:hypothetical protein
VRAWSQWRGRATGLAGTDLSMPAGPVNAALESIFAGEGAVLGDLLHARGGGGYSAGLSLIAIIRRDVGEIVARTGPPDPDPWAGQRRSGMAPTHGPGPAIDHQ